MKIKQLERKQTKIFNAMMNAFAMSGGSYILSLFIKGLIHFIEFVISLPFFMNDNNIYRAMDGFADKTGNFITTIGVILSIICLIDALFLGRKYFKLDKIIKKRKRSYK